MNELFTNRRTFSHIDEQWMSHPPAILVTNSRNTLGRASAELMLFTGDSFVIDMTPTALLEIAILVSCINIFNNNYNSRFAQFALSERNERDERQSGVVLLPRKEVSLPRSRELVCPALRRPYTARVPAGSVCGFAAKGKTFN